MPGKKRGNGKKAIQILFYEEFAEMDAWRRAQPEIPSIAETVRTFVIRGLRASLDGDTIKARAA
jgi:hypothetical protein